MLNCLQALVNDILSLKGELLNIGRGITGHNSSTNIKHASKNVVSIVFKWHHIEEVGGYGLKYSTYRAICRRGGEKTPCVRARNFNEDLMEAYLLKISGPWEQMFTKTIPAKLSSFADTAIKLFRDFHSSMMSRAETHNVRVATLRILGRQLQTHEAAIMDAITAAKIQLTSAQREASRLLVPQMKDQMKELYAKNAGESGKRAFQGSQTCYLVTNTPIRRRMLQSDEGVNGVFSEKQQGAIIHQYREEGRRGCCGGYQIRCENPRGRVRADPVRGTEWTSKLALP